MGGDYSIISLYVNLATNVIDRVAPVILGHSATERLNLIENSHGFRQMIHDQAGIDAWNALETDGHSGHHSEVSATVPEGRLGSGSPLRNSNESNFRFDGIVGWQAEALV